MGRGRQLAEEAFRRYLGEPRTALDLATEGVSAARAEGDLVGESKNECVLGLIAGHLADLTSAERHLRRAARLGGRVGDAASVAEARIHLAYMLVQEGRGRAALAELAAARPAVTESLEPWWHEVQALVLKGLGRWDEAVAEYGLALKAFDRAGDRVGRAKALINRGVALIYGGRLDAGEADMRAADALLEDLGQPLTRIIAIQDLGWAAARRGRVPEALECYDRALVLYGAHRTPPPSLYLDRCEVLLSAGLFVEARSAAQAAVAQAGRSGHAAELSEARVLLAEAALAAGDAGMALDEARLAARDFARQRRPAWRAVARWLIIQASAAGDRPASPAAVRRVAAQLEAAGWLAPALEAWLRAAELELVAGRRAAAERDLEHVARWRRSGPVWYRQLAWQAVAMLRLAHGDRGGARRAAERGMQLIEDYRDSLGATDLRALASRRLSALTDLGVRTALDGGRPALVLRWADRSRAAHLRYPPVSPPDDAELAADLSRLRQVMALRVEAVEAGEPHRADLVRRQTALERSIRDRRRRLPGQGRGSVAALDVPALTAMLGPTTLVEYVVSGGRLHAVTWSGRRLQLHELCPLAELERAVTFLPFTLRQLATGKSRDNRRTTVALDHDGELLDRLLLRPLRLGDGPLVVVPTGVLQGIPWSILPSCAGRPVSVAPSAALWFSARTTAAPRSGVLLVCGPGVPHGEDEIAALARLHADARVLTGADASAEKVLAAMDGVELSHIVAHGDFRADNPQFSALRLADGPLTVYDIERLRQAPRRVVLSACESGRATVLAGDELLGLAPTVLSLGGQAMVASLVLVPDMETQPLMLDLHAQLRAGASLAAALARAQSAARASDNPRSIAAASAFVCIGAG